ncbi:MerR family DNA-binding transcriptional regulator [Polycladomyces sp. WAk]|uniref:MerR family DNA-binding transcriptional regulator n=1 Tax=Polycladomyces zharkentensis TaxID=2807616 RepID=A0ABS2WHM4_9BACL|nr:MerR family DNA-binding transcriptional regulator [Polycladomyces sp. WAk]
MEKRQWKIGELAQASGLTVRTLHYYDQIGLLKPSRHTMKTCKSWPVGGKSWSRCSPVAIPASGSPCNACMKKIRISGRRWGWIRRSLRISAKPWPQTKTETAPSPLGDIALRYLSLSPG